MIGLVLLLSCKQNALTSESNQADFLKFQIENWKKELVINGQVGQPCTADAEQWSAKNPERYYGLPKDSIKSKSFDANNDSRTDYLIYFPAGECCNCVVGMNQASDYVKLIYSNGNKFLSNDNLRKQIATKIKTEYYTQTNSSAERTVFSITDFKEDILGTYQLWTPEDPDCCASIEGTFTYNPFTFNIQITQKNAL